MDNQVKEDIRKLLTGVVESSGISEQGRFLMLQGMEELLDHITDEQMDLIRENALDVLAKSHPKNPGNVFSK